MEVVGLLATGRCSPETWRILFLIIGIISIALAGLPKAA